MKIFNRKYIFSFFTLWSFIFLSFLLLYRSYQKENDYSLYEPLNINSTLSLNNKTHDYLEIKSKILSNQIIETNLSTNSSRLTKIVNQTTKNSKYAYAMLIHGLDESYRYRGFLYNCLIVKNSLQSLGSVSDFIAMIGYSNEQYKNNPIIQQDLQLLKSHGIIIYELQRLLSPHEKQYGKKILFSEMALLKITPWSFTQYAKVQFLDGDVFPFKNLDCFFSLSKNTFNSGNASPLNSGWYIAIPNATDYKIMKNLAIQRLKNKWNEIKGWGTPIPKDLYFRGRTRLVQKWNFNGASLDQGLLLHYFALIQNNIQIIDKREVIIYDPLNKPATYAINEVLSLCGSSIPTSFFHHFTGKSKPWLKIGLKSHNDKRFQLWANHLDRLQLPLNSTNLNEINLKSPLGYFFPNKRY